MKIEFGYELHSNRQVDYDANNLRILNYVREREPSIDHCISCGTCSSACTAAANAPYSLFRLILLARRGEERELADVINRCQFCGKCINACPRNVNTRNIVFIMQYALNKVYHSAILV